MSQNSAAGKKRIKTHWEGKMIFIPQGSAKYCRLRPEAHPVLSTNSSVTWGFPFNVGDKGLVWRLEQVAETYEEKQESSRKYLFPTERKFIEIN